MRLLAIALWWLVSTTLALAQLTMTNVGGAGDGVAYTGPGDITTFTDWWGNRAYTKAIAIAGTTPAVNLSRASDSHTCDVLVGTTGLTNTANCSTGADNGTPVGTWCAATTCSYLIWYDQAATLGNHNAAYDGTLSHAPTYTTTGMNGRPCASFNGSTSALGINGVISTANPYTQDVAYNAALVVTAAYEAIISGTFGNYMVYVHGTGLLDNGGAQANGSASTGFTSSDGIPHAVTFVGNGASSVYNLDGVDTTFTTGGGALGGSMFLGTNSTSANNFTGCMGEAGYINSALSSGLRASLAANKQSWYSITGVGTGGYSGPGDAVAGLKDFYALRGETQAYANGVNHAAVLRRASDNALFGLAVQASGDANTAAAVTWAGTDATCTGSQTASATLVISGCASGTIHVGDQISGTGITNPTWITAIGTCGSGAGSCTTSFVRTYGPTTVTATVAMYVAAMPDQGSTGNTTQQNTAGSQPEFLVNCLNTTKPCMYFNGSTSTLGTGGVSGSQPDTWTSVMERLGSFTSQQNSESSATVTQALGFNNSTNTIFSFAGTFINGTAADSAPHSVMGGFSGASSFLNIDGTSATANAGANAFTGAYTIGSSPVLNGYFSETGIWSNLFSAGNQSAMHTNMSGYWGTP